MIVYFCKYSLICSFSGSYRMHQGSSVYSYNLSPNGSRVATIGAENFNKLHNSEASSASNHVPPNYSFSPQTPSSPTHNVTHNSQLCSPLTVSRTNKNADKHSYNTKPPPNKNAKTKCPSGRGTNENKAQASESGMISFVCFFWGLF